MKGQAKDWPTVDPEALRSWADCRTWEDLDYYIAARVSMIQLQIACGDVSSCWMCGATDRRDRTKYRGIDPRYPQDGVVALLCPSGWHRP